MKPGRFRYAAEQARRDEVERQKAIAEKKALEDELASMKEQLKNPPTRTDEENFFFYSRLAFLEPTNRDYVRFRDNWAKRVEQNKIKAEAEKLKAEAANHPERYIQIKQLRWRKEAFDTVMMIDVTLVNTSPIAIKDISITCTHSAESGTRIDSNAKTIYQVVKANSSRTINDFNMGFIHSQAASTSCSVTSAVAAS